MSEIRKTGRPTKKEIRKSKGTQKTLLIGEMNPFYGKSHTKETKERLSELRKGSKVAEHHLIKWKRFGEENSFYGKKHSEEAKEKIRQKAIGRKASEETKRKLKNRIYSEEIRKKMSESQKNRPPRDEAFRLKMKAQATEYWRKKKQLKTT